jgi:hypothetical protein
MSESISIGEINQTVFDCPSCARPLAIGVKRCPGCGTRLLFGVPLAKATLLASTGIAIGIAIGGVFGFGVGLIRPLAAAAISDAPVASQAPLASLAPVDGGTGSGGTGTVPDLQIPPLSRSALAQTLDVDARLVANADLLRAALTARVFDAPTVAQTLRSMAADSVIGRQLADHVRAWTGSAAVGRDLDDLYVAIHGTASDALISSVRDQAAYRTAATRMLVVLEGLSAVDGAARTLASQSGVNVPASPAP